MIGSKLFDINGNNVFDGEAFQIGKFEFTVVKQSEACNARSFVCGLNRTTSITLRFDYWEDHEDENCGYVRLIASLFCKPLLHFKEAIIIKQWNYTVEEVIDTKEETIQRILKELFKKEIKICDKILKTKNVEPNLLRETRNLKVIVSKLLGIIYVSEMTDTEKIDHLSKELETLRAEHEELKEQVLQFLRIFKGSVTPKGQL